MTKLVILLAPLVPALTTAATAATAAERSVLRPADSVWDDAASLRANRGLSATARRREAFQNPGVLDPRRLAQGFEDATRPLAEAGQEAGRYLEDGARQFTDGTRGFVERSNDNLRNGARSVLDGTANQLERLDPTSRDAYGGRPAYSSDNGQDQRLAPPEPTRADDRFADPRQTEPLRGRVDPADAQRAYDGGRGYEPDYRSPDYDRERYPSDSRGPALAQPDRGYDDRTTSDRGLAERFAGEDDRFSRVDDRRTVDPIPRRSLTTSRDDRFDAFGDERESSRGFAPRDDFARDDYDRRAPADEFPSMPDRRSGWDDNVARGQSPATTTANRYPTQRVDNTGFAGGGVANADNAVASWNGSAGSGPNAANPNATNNPNLNQAGVMNTGRDSAWDMDRLLMVIMAFASCYVLIAHLDLRSRYRAALRGAPVGYGNPLSDI